MTNTATFPHTIDYTPGSQLMGMLRLTEEERAGLVAVLRSSREIDGADLTFHSEWHNEYYVDLFFEVAPDDVDAVAGDLLVTMEQLDLL